MSKTIKILGFIVLVGFFISDAYAAVQAVDEGPVHEAFISPIRSILPLNAIPTKPPRPITEKIPQQIDQDTEWIPGYWAWSKDRRDFVWVTGVWRRIPPGHRWIPGNWKQYNEGWVWQRGFWSKVPERELVSITIAPPDPADEDAGQPPSADSFWVPGFWQYQPERKTFGWIAGYWDKLDPDWVLVPSTYVWRNDGYIYLAAYWDWALDERGSAYSNVFIPVTERSTVIHEPRNGLDSSLLVHRLFVDYPNYLCFFQHHYYYHPHFWVGFPGVPPWWGWPGWWALPWQHQWAVWWWWGHPGFPQPQWINANLTQLIPPPPAIIVALLKSAHGPAIITPKGVVSANQLINALQKVEGSNKFKPILPSNPKLLDRVVKLAEPKVEIGTVLKPAGEGYTRFATYKETPLKPRIETDLISRVIPPGSREPVTPRGPLSLPSKPKLSVVVPRVPEVPQHPPSMIPEGHPRPVKPVNPEYFVPQNNIQLPGPGPGYRQQPRQPQLREVEPNVRRPVQQIDPEYGQPRVPNRQVNPSYVPPRVPSPSVEPKHPLQSRPHQRITPQIQQIRPTGKEVRKITPQVEVTPQPQRLPNQNIMK